MLGVSMQNESVFHYSFGKDKFDNKPSQNVVESFDEFKKHILVKRSPTKGMNFFCSALPTPTPEENPKGSTNCFDKYLKGNYEFKNI
jgi:hypothetical protein